MARLNSMFPAVTLVDSTDDFDLSPCSPALRDSIRFTVYESLMSNNTPGPQQQQAIKMRLLCWCDIPGYPQAWQAMARYSEEVKKLEEVCLEALHLMEMARLDADSDLRPCSAPPVPNALLKGMPGREISTAKTDGAAFAGDIDAAPVLSYPSDLSRHSFDQHPLARALSLNSRQKASLGLILPKQLKSRDF